MWWWWWSAIVPRHKLAASIARTNGLWTRSYAARRTTPQSATLGLHPVIHVPNYMDHYSFTDSWGMDGWVGHVGWPIADGLTTKWSPIQLAVWLRQDSESSPAETSVLTTMLRRQHTGLADFFFICKVLFVVVPASNGVCILQASRFCHEWLHKEEFLSCTVSNCVSVTSVNRLRYC